MMNVKWDDLEVKLMLERLTQGPASIEALAESIGQDVYRIEGSSETIAGWRVHTHKVKSRARRWLRIAKADAQIVYSRKDRLYALHASWMPQDSSSKLAIQTWLKERSPYLHASIGNIRHSVEASCASLNRRTVLGRRVYAVKTTLEAAENAFADLGRN